MTLEAIKQLLPNAEARPCVKCECPILLVHNVESKKTGPADLRAPVYFVRKPPAAGPGGKPLAMTAGKLMEILESLTVRVGTEIVTYKADEILGFFVSHFNTCPSASHFGDSRRPVRGMVTPPKQPPRRPGPGWGSAG